MRSPFQLEVTLFRDWADGLSPEDRRGEWEERYPRGRIFDREVARFLRNGCWTDWTDGEVEDLLYAIARDNENQTFAEMLPEAPECVLLLARASLSRGEAEARWQLAMQLGTLASGGPKVEAALLLFLADDHEYVRRQALRSLALIGSAATEHYCAKAWATGDPYQRMTALEALRAVDSKLLDGYLDAALRDTGGHLEAFARRLKEEAGR